MQVAGRHEQRLAGGKLDVVEQQRDDHPGVGRVPHGEVRRHPPFGAELAARVGPAGRRHRTHQPGPALGRQGEQRGHHPAQAVRRGQHRPVRGKLRDTQPVEQPYGLRHRAEPAERVERRQRAEHLGLVAAVGVVALRGVRRDAARILPCVPRTGRLERRVRLQRQRFRRGQHLEQERQPRPELSQHRGAELALRVGRDPVRQGPVAGQPGRRRRVCAHPQLRLRPAGGRDTEQLGDRRWRAPVVVPDGVVQPVRRHRHALPSCACADRCPASSARYRSGSR